MEHNIKIITGVTLTPAHHRRIMTTLFHKTFRHAVVAVALSLAASSSFAGNGVDPATIVYKDWGDTKPKVLVILPRVPKVNKAITFFSQWKGEFEWRGSDELTQIGNDLLKRNHFEPYGNGHFVISVTELYLGVPEGLLKVLRPHRTGNSQWLSEEDVRNIPFGAMKVLYISTKAVSSLAGEGIEAIAVAFEEVSDADLRRIAFEEAVLRELRYRED